MKRLLVTGSRNWKNRELLEDALDYAVMVLGAPVVLVHGDCPTGADRMADEWAVKRGIEIERHPAEWERYGKSAGPLRNQKMVDLGADLVAGFPHPDSRGTKDCLDRAKAARLRILKTEED